MEILNEERAATAATAATQEEKYAYDNYTTDPCYVQGLYAAVDAVQAVVRELTQARVEVLSINVYVQDGVAAAKIHFWNRCIGEMNLYAETHGLNRQKLTSTRGPYQKYRELCWMVSGVKVFCLPETGDWERETL